MNDIAKEQEKIQTLLNGTNLPQSNPDLDDTKKSDGGDAKEFVDSSGVKKIKKKDDPTDYVPELERGEDLEI